MIDQNSRVSVGTYNLHGLADPAGLTRTLKKLEFVDIWAFQEINEVTTVSTNRITLQESPPPVQLRRILPAGDWNIYYVPMNRSDDSGQRVWEGQAIASRYPLTRQEVWPLRATGTKKRAALACDVAVADTKLFVVNTDHEIGLMTIGPTDRGQQVEDLLGNLSQCSPTGKHPTVILGDFNTVGYPLQPWRMNSTEEIRSLQRSFRRIGIQSLPGLKAPCPTFKCLGISRALDHILLGNATCCQWGTTENYVGSDHRPLWVTVDMKRRTEASDTNKIE